VTDAVLYLLKLWAGAALVMATVLAAIMSRNAGEDERLEVFCGNFIRGLLLSLILGLIIIMLGETISLIFNINFLKE
jgi:hypothetical protein